MAERSPPPHKASKLRSLEMLRAVAALLVVMFHAQGIFQAHTGVTPFAGLFVSGFRGVDLFFVISGFIIAHVHSVDIGRPWRLANYVFNRAARIYPAVWVMTLFAAALYATGFGGGDKTAKLAGWSVAASMLLLPQAGDAIVSVTWSLKYEVFFYLVFAVLILDRRIGMTLLVTWQLAVLVASVWFPDEYLGPGGFYLRSPCLEFSVGLAAAWLIGRPGFVAGMQAASAQWTWLATGIIAFGCGMLPAIPLDLAGVFSACGAGTIIVGLILLEQLNRLHVPSPMVRLGAHPTPSTWCTSPSSPYWEWR